MRLLGIATAALMAAAPATSVMAEGFSVRDLLEVRDRDECLRRAELAMNAHSKSHGGDVVVTEWIVYGWDFGPGDNDISLMCPVVNGGVINAFMVIHGEDIEENRTFVADEIERLFN